MSKYKVGDKFILEIGESYATEMPFGVEDGSPMNLYKAKGFNSLVLDAKGLDKLEKLNPKLKIEDIDDMLAEHDLKKESYNKGLQDAWELALKVSASEKKEGISNDVCRAVFGTLCGAEIMRNNTPQEALAKIEAYEKEQEQTIKVGDVVEGRYDKSVTVVVTSLSNDDTFNGINAKGRCFSGRYVRDWKKTGKHIDIANILAEIGKE